MKRIIMTEIKVVNKFNNNNNKKKNNRNVDATAGKTLEIILKEMTAASHLAGPLLKGAKKGQN